MLEWAISKDAVRLALRHVHTRGTVYATSPLLNADFLHAYMVSKGQGTSWTQAKARSEALAGLLRDRIQAEMTRLDPGFAGSDSTPPAMREERIDQMVKGAAENPDVRMWVVAFLWTLAGAKLPQGRIANRLGVTTRTVRSDLTSVHVALAKMLLEEEERARSARPAEEGEPPRVADRSDGPPYLSVDETDRTRHCLRTLGAFVRTGIGPRPGLDTLATVRTASPRDLDDYCLSRIAEWMEPDHQFDQRFVPLSLRLWQDQVGVPGKSLATKTATLFPSVQAALDALGGRLIAIVGIPGAGKSAELGHLEWSAARARVQESSGPLPVYVRLDRYGESSGTPLAWLRSHWASLHPHLPPFADLYTSGKLLLLLDGLNEMRHADAESYSRQVAAWKRAARRILAAHKDNRIVVSCRTMDYTTPLSSPKLRVPRLEIQPLDQDRIGLFLTAYAPQKAAALRRTFERFQQRDALSVPYYLKLLIEQAQSPGFLSTTRVGILTGIVRSRLRREIEADNVLFLPSPVLSERDRWRMMQVTRWRSDWELPEDGTLFPALSRLASTLQELQPPGGDAERDLGYRQTIDALGPFQPKIVLAIGKTLGILTDNPVQDAVSFSHQQMREYFTARLLAQAPSPELVRRPWQAQRQDPPLAALLERLHPDETLPGLPQTGWEEPTLLASEMALDPDGFVQGLMVHNLSLAGACGVVLRSQSRLSEDVANRLRSDLEDRSRNPEADLRDRIVCARTLAELGDPRFPRMSDPGGDYLLPPMVEIEGGVYPIGEDEPIESTGAVSRGHMPRHDFPVAPFSIGKFPVTNAEFALFMKAGGYDDPQWWDDTAASIAWQRGEGTGAMLRESQTDAVAFYRKNPKELSARYKGGAFDAFDKTLFAAWSRWIQLPDDELASDFLRLYPDERLRAPLAWHSDQFNHPSQPVVGITWYEARAYCRWLSARSGLAFRLPTEVEWEAAARGTEGRRWAGGNESSPLAYNVLETRIRFPSPIGVFPDGDTPEGVSDLSGGVFEWTSSAWGESDQEPTFAYEYDAQDGREAADTSYRVRRVTRGGSMWNDVECARTAFRGITSPGLRAHPNGMRLAQSRPE